MCTICDWRKKNLKQENSIALFKVYNKRNQTTKLKYCAKQKLPFSIFGLVFPSGSLIWNKRKYTRITVAVFYSIYIKMKWFFFCCFLNFYLAGKIKFACKILFPTYSTSLRLPTLILNKQWYWINWKILVSSKIHSTTKEK